MDATAIRQIQETATAKGINDRLEKLSSAFESDLLLVPDGHSLRSTECFQSQPNRFEGVFKTAYIADFSRYVNVNGSLLTSVFVDARNMACTAIIDCGNDESPQWRSHRAELRPMKTQEYSSFLVASNISHSQGDFIDFCEDWLANIDFYDARKEMLDRGQALDSLRKMTIENMRSLTSEVQGLKRSISEFDAIEMSSGAMPPPAFFTFTCRPYEEIEEFSLSCRLRYKPSDKFVVIKMIVERFGAIENAIGAKFLELLKSSIESTEAFYCGTME